MRSHPALLLAIAGWLAPAPGSLAAAQERVDRLAAFELDLTGPLEGVVIEVAEAGSARLEGPFGAGSAARIELFLPRPARGPLPPPRVLALWGEGSAGRAEVRPLEGRDAAREARFAGLPRALRARTPAAPPETGPPPPPASALWLLAGVFALGLALRRRPAPVLALGLSGAALALVLARGPAEPSSVVVAEAAGPEPEIVLVEAARDRLLLGAADVLLRLETRPSGAPLELAGEPARGELTARAVGASLFAFRDGSALSLARAENGVFDLDQVWVRGAGEQRFLAAGPWRLGEPLPAAWRGGPSEDGAAGESPDPPGWLVAGLPMGTGAVVGGGRGRWLRWVDPPAE